MIGGQRDAAEEEGEGGAEESGLARAYVRLPGHLPLRSLDS